MRNGLAVVCLMASACATENELRYTSTLQAETNGVVLSENGLDMFAAMSGTTCTIDTNWGCPIDDADLPTSEEKVVDHWGGITLGVTAMGVHTIVYNDNRNEPRSEWDDSKDEIVAKVRTASIIENGHVLVHGDENACFYQVSGQDPIEVDGSACAEGATFSVDRANGILYAATSSGMIELGADRANLPERLGDLADFDPTLQHIYAAFSGSEELRAYNRAREEVWEVNTTGPIRSLATRGKRGEVMVLVDRPDNMAAIERRDGRTGRLLGQTLVPTSDGTLESSDNGRTITVIRSDEVNFFAFDGDNEPVIDETPPNCIVPTADGPDINLGD